MVSLSNHPSIAMSIIRQTQDDRRNGYEATLHKPWRCLATRCGRTWERVVQGKRREAWIWTAVVRELTAVVGWTLRWETCQ